MHVSFTIFFFFFKDTATPEIYTLSLHDALPICPSSPAKGGLRVDSRAGLLRGGDRGPALRPGKAEESLLVQVDRKSTRLNSSHTVISYAVFCLKKKKKQQCQNTQHNQQI